MAQPRLPARVRRLFRLEPDRERGAHTDADDELSSFLVARSDDLMSRGMTRGEAEAEAMRRLGSAPPGELRDRLRRSAAQRERRLGIREHIEAVVQDVRIGARRLVKEPVIGAVAVLTMALGVGTNTAIFTVVDDVLFRPLPVSGPNELVAIGKLTAVDGNTTGGARPDLFSVPLYHDVRDRSRTVSGLAATGTAGWLEVRLTANGEFEHPDGRFVSENFFGVLGVRAERGWVFGTPEGGAAGSSPVAVISDGYWRDRLNSASDVIGRDIIVDGVKVTVVGVTQQGFTGEIVERPTDIWLPIEMRPALQPHAPPMTDRGTCWLLMIGRLAPGATLAQARAEFASLIRTILVSTTASPDEAARYRNAPVGVVSGAQGISWVRHSFRSALVTLQVGVGVLLLIVCLNLTNLVLARAVARGPEMSLRMALGAGRRRLVRQLVTESAIVGALGAAAGLGAAWWGSRALVSAATAGSAAAAARVGWPIMVFTLVIAVGATLCFGLIPAFQASRGDAASPMRSLGRTVGASTGGRIPVGRLLVPLQVAMSMVLLTAAALLSRGLRRVEAQHLGLDRSHLLVADLDRAQLGVTGQAFLTLGNALIARIGSVPGVRSVTYSENGVFSGRDGDALVAVPGFTGRTSDDSLLNYDLVGPGYLAGIGATLLRGRDLDARDGPEHPSVIVLNETAARFYFGGANAVGKVMYFDPKVPSTVVGVVADVRDHSLGGPPVRRAYTPYAQQIADTEHPSMSLEIRTSGDPARRASAVRAAIASVDPELPLVAVNPLSVRVRESIRQDRLLVTLSFGFGAAALLLAAVGLYGVMSYAVTRRTGEIGLRSALGASRGNVLRLVLGDGLRMVALGIAIGAPATWLAARALRSQLHDVPPTDPVSVVTALGVLVACATVAVLLPAWRASHLAPAIALNSER